MNCWQCKTELIWADDQDISSEEDCPFCMVSTFSCPSCNAHVEFYVPKDSYNETLQTRIIH